MKKVELANPNRPVGRVLNGQPFPNHRSSRIHYVVFGYAQRRRSKLDVKFKFTLRAADRVFTVQLPVPICRADVLAIRDKLKLGSWIVSILIFSP